MNSLVGQSSCRRGGGCQKFKSEKLHCSLVIHLGRKSWVCVSLKIEEVEQQFQSNPRTSTTDEKNNTTFIHSHLLSIEALEARA